MNIQEAKSLVQGSTVYHNTKKNADGSRMKAKVLSVKTWKTRPDDVLVSLKRGLYEYAKFNQDEIFELSAK